MLEDCLFASHSSARSKKPATLALSVLVHGAIGCVLILIPLFQAQVLPRAPIFEPLAPPVSTFRTVELAPVPRGQSSGGGARIGQPGRAIVEPIGIPSTIAIIDDDSGSTLIGANLLPSGSGPGNSPFGSPFGDPNSIGGGPDGPPSPPKPTVAAPPPPPPPPPAPPVAGPVRMGGQLVQSNLIRTVTPEYPRLAALSRVEGVVLLEATITREGVISDLRVVSGHRLLQDAAIDAVKQWRYRPTLLNGVPVDVITTITVNFTLN